jgi:CubicO group peptidase (beta-lactamase class C family)
MGLASKDLEVPATRETKFRIGEVSEIFTSFIYLRMVEDGLLQPDSSIQHYIPDFPEKEFKITLHHLANHVSGFRDPTMNEKDSRMQNITLQKGLDIFKEDRILSPPQTYQTINIFEYNLLGAIMEKATNKKFREILQEYCTDTLKLTNTTIDNPFVTIKGRTDFYNHDIIANVINATFRDFRYSAPSQGLLSNAEDLVKLGNAILYSDILSQETKEKIFKTVTLLDNSQTNLANGWVIIIDKNDNDLYGKKGSIMGGSSSILIYPKYGLVIASATNLLPNNESAPVFEMAEYFIDQEAAK